MNFRKSLSFLSVNCSEEKIRLKKNKVESLSRYYLFLAEFAEIRTNRGPARIERNIPD